MGRPALSVYMLLAAVPAIGLPAAGVSEKVHHKGTKDTKKLRFLCVLCAFVVNLEANYCFSSTAQVLHRPLNAVACQSTRKPEARSMIA